MVNSRSSKLRESAFVQPTLVGLNFGGGGLGLNEMDPPQ